MEAKFTKGKWLRDGNAVYALEHAGYKKGIEQFQNRFYAAVQAAPNCPAEEAEANARLIAEAPAMFADIQALLDAAWNGPIDAEHPARKRAAATLARAKGETVASTEETK